MKICFSSALIAIVLMNTSYLAAQLVSDEKASSITRKSNYFGVAIATTNIAVNTWTNGNSLYLYLAFQIGQSVNNIATITAEDYAYKKQSKINITMVSLNLACAGYNIHTAANADNWYTTTASLTQAGIQIWSAGQGIYNEGA